MSCNNVVGLEVEFGVIMREVRHSEVNHQVGIESEGSL